MPHRNLEMNYTPPTVVAFKSGAISSTAIGLTDLGFTAEEIAEAERAIISTHATEVHMRWDGGNPTGTTGIMLDEGSGAAFAVIVGSENLQNLKFIKESGGADGTLSVMLEKQNT
ncbi:MAG: hypothetical protein HUJ26_18915 [Planctomycetaceae bacterium]|nr:hypothetical protein [Planctomycetaceae bacterium]